MKTLKKSILLFMILLSSLILGSTFCNAATVTANNEETLISAINNAANGDIIELTENIVLTKPIEITGKSITINGNGHTVTRNATNWSPNGSNGSLITAGAEGTKLSLVNITLSGAQKYGVQSYNGAYVVLNGVTLSDNGFGGVLVNAGTLEVKNVVLHKNGQTSNNGIEIAKGNGITTQDNHPVLIMNGTLSSSEKENVIYIAINDQLSTFEVKNTDSSTNKVFIKDNKVVVTDAQNNIIFESNAAPNITIAGSDYVENVVVPDNGNTEEKPAVKPNEKPAETPKTGLIDSLIIAVSTMFILLTTAIILKKKLA